MSWSFWISLSLGYLPIIGSMRETMKCSSLSPPNSEIWHKKGQSASLPCTLSCSGTDIQPQWFAFKENSHHQVYPSTTPLKYSLDGTSLHIMSLNLNDSGIYHCAVENRISAPGAQIIGSGTTLIVRGEKKQMLGGILMWLSFVLLAMYSMAVIILIILKKKGRKIGIYRQIGTTAKSSSRKRSQFRAVVQELYSRENVENNTQKDRHPTQNKAEITQSSHSNDDIYQNL